jgi:glycosyltransferase involved in cell wall biosynthesis
VGSATQIDLAPRQLKPSLLAIGHSRSERISVCHLASGDAWGGAEAQLTTLLRALSRCRELDVCAIVLNEGRLARELRRCDIEVRVIPERENSFWQIVSQARGFMRAKDVQILHAHRYKENFIGALLACDEPGVRLVKTQHGRTETLSGIAGAKQWLAHTIDRLTMRYADDVVISVSSQLTGYLKKYVSRDRIAVIPNGIDLASVHCTLSRSEAKKQLGIPEEAPVVGFIGRLERVKRLDIFVHSAREIQRQSASTKFVIAGSGREERQLRQLIAQQGLEDHFILLGHQDDTSPILRAMDLLLLTSDHEGLPMVLLEAMALGTLVVAHKVGGIAEVLADRQSGLLVEDRSPANLASVCVQALQDTSTTERLTRAAREVVESRYCGNQNGKHVLELYASLT